MFEEFEELVLAVDGITGLVKDDAESDVDRKLF